MLESCPQVSELAFRILRSFATTYTMPLRERFFSSCTYQNRKHEIKPKLKMMQDLLHRALNHEALNWLCCCKVNRRTNRCEIDQLFEIK